jgi:hypothetical protein
MDKTEKLDWSWLPRMMPGVARLMHEKRSALGDAHVNECWKLGVVQRKPGWFYVREGAIAVGTPWGEDIPDYTASQALVMIREPGVAHGA